MHLQTAALGNVSTESPVQETKGNSSKMNDHRSLNAYTLLAGCALQPPVAERVAM